MSVTSVENTAGKNAESTIKEQLTVYMKLTVDIKAIGI